MNHVMLARIRRALFGAYLTIIFVIGVLFVPIRAVWGPENQVEYTNYVPIWLLEKMNYTINGYILRYELCVGRIMFELLLLTIIFLVVYFICKENLILKEYDTEDKLEDENINFKI